MLITYVNIYRTEYISIGVISIRQNAKICHGVPLVLIKLYHGPVEITGEEMRTEVKKNIHMIKSD